MCHTHTLLSLSSWRAQWRQPKGRGWKLVSVGIVSGAHRWSSVRPWIGENMGKLQEFEIAFEKNKVVYSPGESISGSVTIKLGQPLQCKGESSLILRLFRQHVRTWWENIAVAKHGSERFSRDYPAVPQAWHTIVWFWTYPVWTSLKCWCEGLFMLYVGLKCAFYCISHSTTTVSCSVIVILLGLLKSPCSPPTEMSDSTPTMDS